MALLGLEGDIYAKTIARCAFEKIAILPKGRDLNVIEQRAALCSIRRCAEIKTLTTRVEMRDCLPKQCYFHTCRKRMFQLCPCIAQPMIECWFVIFREGEIRNLLSVTCFEHFLPTWR